MPPPKLHLNEHISWHIAEQLRKLDFDVRSTLELDMVDEDDDVPLEFAVSQQRAIVSINHSRYALGSLRAAFWRSNPLKGTFSFLRRGDCFAKSARNDVTA